MKLFSGNLTRLLVIVMSVKVALPMSFSQNLEDKIDDRLSKLSKTFPGLSCSVVKNNRIIYSKGFGWLDMENQIPFTDSTIFNICSILKTFTGVALAKLHEYNVIGMDEPIAAIDNSSTWLGSLNDEPDPLNHLLKIKYDRLHMRS